MPPKMTANPLKPARYRAGKAAGTTSSSDSDSEVSGDEVAKQEPQKRQLPPSRPAGAGKVLSTGSISKLDLNQRRLQEEAQRQARLDMERKALEEGFVTEESESGEEDEESGSEQSEESSSEDEAPKRLMMRPKFIPKSQRNGGAGATAAGKAKSERERQEEEAAELAAEEARKKALTDQLVEEQIRKDIAARAAGKKHWDDGEDEEDDIDTQDDVDPEAEYALWKLRELKRIKRSREQIVAREQEREETERRRNLTEEERKAEDEAYLAKQKEEKEGRGKMAYMQKYYHKGAFFQDDSKAAGLDKRDIMGARFVDEIRNRELLPKALQMRDMTKLGRKGATKYKDLKSEDTGQWGRFEDTRPGRRGYDRFGDERFQPDRDRDGGKGANAIPLGERKRVPGAPEGPQTDRSRAGDGYCGRYQPRDDNRERRHSRSRSRSLGRNHRDDYRDRRKRSSSRERDRYDSDKRRRIDAG